MCNINLQCLKRSKNLYEKLVKNKINAMAVPKKRTSKSKKNIRKNTWKKKVIKQALRALFLTKSLQKKNNVEKPAETDKND
jgi:hypothetical protein